MQDADVDLMARMVRAEGEEKHVMLYVIILIVNRAVANCLDIQYVRTIEVVIFQIQRGNTTDT